MSNPDPQFTPDSSTALDPVDTRHPLPVIAITSGEPAGIGPDLIAYIQPQNYKARLVIIGDQQLLEQRAQTLKQKLELIPYDVNSIPEPPTLEVLNVPLHKPVTSGQLDVENAHYVLDLLNTACDACLRKEFDAMVTAPIQKDIINTAGIPFTGHTEYLAQRCGEYKPVMLLATSNLRVALATTHLPLREVPAAINAQELGQVLNIMHHDLQLKFGIANPHIKVCGLNPHAGENGYLGREEIDIIIPLLQKLKSEGLNVTGPYPADTVFTQDSLKDADAILAMYHDQGLPVLKHAGFNHAINTTLGLPIIRTSVDHGTALHLAGSGKANASSLFAAIESAIQQSEALQNSQLNKASVK